MVGSGRRTRDEESDDATRKADDLECCPGDRAPTAAGSIPSQLGGSDERATRRTPP
jgi:hypothetical protein